MILKVKACRDFNFQDISTVVNTFREFLTPITFKKGTYSCSGQSILGIVAFRIWIGDEFTIEFDGNENKQILDIIKQLHDYFQIIGGLDEKNN